MVGIYSKETPHKEQDVLLRNKAEMLCFNLTDFLRTLYNIQ